MKTRLLEFDGAFNFRDLGGYAAAGGRTVKWGKLFRSDDLMDLSRADRAKLAELGIRTVVDFRDPVEARMYPDRLPDTVKERRFIPIEAGKLMRSLADGGMTREKSLGIMISVYRALVNDFQHSFRELLGLVADSSNIPLLFHCTAGKDRTGMAAAFILSALGVDRETVIADFMLSRDCLKRKYIEGQDYDSVMEPLYSVHREYMETALDLVDHQYGGMEKYLAERLGVDLEAMRALFTE